ncbi:hypothetical protein KCU93_g68, partial [Aureobasidium melanogenum]
MSPTDSATIIAKSRLENTQAAIGPDWCDVEGNGMDQTQKETKIRKPSMKNIQSLVPNSSEERDEICFHAKTNDPRHHCNRNHACSDGQWRRTELDALPVQRLRDEAVEHDEDYLSLAIRSSQMPQRLLCIMQSRPSLRRTFRTSTMDLEYSLQSDQPDWCCSESRESIAAKPPSDVRHNVRVLDPDATRLSAARIDV